MPLDDFILVSSDQALKVDGKNFRRARDFLFKNIQSYSNVDVVSPYYSTDFIEEAFPAGALSGQCLRLIFAAAPTVRRAEQLCDLRKIKGRLMAERRCQIEIYLTTSIQFLHSKLVALRSGGKGKPRRYFIGSANFSSNGYYNNDEIMLSLRGYNASVESYLNYLIAHSEEISDLKNTQERAHTWREFLRNAYLYYRPTHQLSYTVDCFANDEFKIVRETLSRALGGERLLYSDDTNRLTLSIPLLLELDSEQSSKRTSVNPYAVETDYGLWVPQFYVRSVEERVERAAEPRKKRLAQQGQQLSSKTGDFINERIQAFIRAVNQRLVTQNHGRLSLRQAATVTQMIARRIDGLRRTLTREDTIERHARSWIGAPVADFWEDQASSNEFFDSFCEDLVYKINAQKPSVMINHLKQVFEVKDTDDASACRRRIESYFRDGWEYDQNNWPPGV